MEEQNYSLKEMQDKMLEMILYFKEICDENNLMFYLCGGCLIGAVRHNGFIPWDDDIDIFMPRPDYERLGKIWREKADTSRYSYCRTSYEENYHDGGASIRDNNTTVINRHSINEDINQGLALEIMPIDGCPKSKIKRIKQLYQAIKYSIFNVQRLPNNKGKIIRNITKIIYKLIPSGDVRYRIWKKAEKEMSKYKWEDVSDVTELIGSIKGMLIRHLKSDFNEVEYLSFEGHELPVMKGYKKYLEEIWGNYMELPPVEKRVAKHDTIFIDLNNGYKKYKGIYYLKNKKDLKEEEV